MQYKKPVFSVHNKLSFLSHSLAFCFTSLSFPCFTQLDLSLVSFVTSAFLPTCYTHYNFPCSLWPFINVASFPLSFSLVPSPSPQECRPALNLTFPQTHLKHGLSTYNIHTLEFPVVSLVEQEMENIDVQ